MKAAINGAINLSVLDGWWAEGFDGSNGWAIDRTTSAGTAEYRSARRRRTTCSRSSRTKVVPMYFDRGHSTRLGRDGESVDEDDHPAVQRRTHGARVRRKAVLPRRAPNLAVATNHTAEHLAEWKKRVGDQWHGVRLERIDAPTVSSRSRRTDRRRVTRPARRPAAAGRARRVCGGSGRRSLR